MRIMKPKMAKLAPGAPPMGAPASLGTPKLPRAAGAGPVKPRLRTRHLSTTGKTAFGPKSATAFGTPSPGASDPGQAFAGPGPMAAAMGDQGD